MSYTENLEKTLLKVIDDLAPFLDSLVLVGGWVPFLYRNYLWKEEIEKPVYTTCDGQTISHCTRCFGIGKRTTYSG